MTRPHDLLAQEYTLEGRRPAARQIVPAMSTPWRRFLAAVFWLSFPVLASGVGPHAVWATIVVVFAAFHTRAIKRSRPRFVDCSS